MTSTNKEKVRNEIAKDPYSWVIVDGILGETPSSSIWDKEVEIIYEDMDGQPCMCNAVYSWDYTGRRFKATNGPAKGNWMSSVIAYRPLER